MGLSSIVSIFQGLSKLETVDFPKTLNQLLSWSSIVSQQINVYDPTGAYETHTNTLLESPRDEVIKILGRTKLNSIQEALEKLNIHSKCFEFYRNCRTDTNLEMIFLKPVHAASMHAAIIKNININNYFQVLG
jgi:hypothetical protein